MVVVGAQRVVAIGVVWLHTRTRISVSSLLQTSPVRFVSKSAIHIDSPWCAVFGIVFRLLAPQIEFKFKDTIWWVHRSRVRISVLDTSAKQIADKWLHLDFCECGRQRKSSSSTIRQRLRNRFYAKDCLLQEVMGAANLKYSAMVSCDLSIVQHMEVFGDLLDLYWFSYILVIVLGKLSILLHSETTSPYEYILNYQTNQMNTIYYVPITSWMNNYFYIVRSIKYNNLFYFQNINRQCPSAAKNHTVNHM